jgi:hypothetical protein
MKRVIRQGNSSTCANTLETAVSANIESLQ